MKDKYPSKVWAGFDWKQAELYILCLFSKDSILREALYSRDFHKYVASFLEDIHIEDVSAEQREFAKTLSFNLIYSGFNVEITKSNILKKRRDLLEDTVIEALEKYKETFFCLFNWVQQAVLDWRGSGGYLSYLLGAKKFIPVPAYIHPDSEPDKLLNTHQGRLCINTYGQGSVGLLLKHTYYNMFLDTIIRDKTSQHIPIFDAMNFLVETEYLDYVLEKVDGFATPIIEFDQFEIQMAVDWKLSPKSWGDMKKVKLDPSLKNVLHYTWTKPEDLNSEPVSSEAFFSMLK